MNGNTRLGILLLATALIPALLAGQEYPLTHYLTGLDRHASGGDFGGPNWWSVDYYDYHCESVDPLVVTEITRHHIGHMEGCEPSDFYQTLDFVGELALYPDYYIITSPLTLEPNINPTRTRKMDYQGYCHEDDWYSYYYYHYHAWHSYNAEMKLIRTVIKRVSATQPDQWRDSFYTLDSLGRRVEELTLVSADSLNWINYLRRQYSYSEEQFPPGYQFEKHSQHLPDYILMSVTYRVPYLNDQWMISEMTEQQANSEGVWYDPQTWTYDIEVEEGTVTVSVYGDTFNTFNAKGMLTSIALWGADGIPSYEFHYAYTLNTAAEENTPQVLETLRAWPNPAREGATLDLPGKFLGPLTLSTFNIRGQLVKEEIREVDAQKNSIEWLACDDRGRPLNSGLYLIRVRSRDLRQTAKVIVAR